MTVSKEVKYLDIDLMEKMCHKIAVAVFDTKEDPIALFHEHNENLLDSALNQPKWDKAYPSIIDKAVILYYVLNKNHPFKNGNKRISATSLLIFLWINNYWLNVSNEELYNKTLYIAKSDRTDKNKIIEDTKQWVKNNLITLSEFIKNQKKL